MIVNEFEHQELFYPNIDLNRPLEFHCPSPLGHMRYYFFLRLDPAWIGRLGAMTLTADLHGLRDTAMWTAAGEGFDGLEGGPVFPAKTPGKVWFMAAAGKMARGDGVLRFEGLPSDFPRVDLLACSWPRFVREGWACDQLALRDDPAWAPGGVPLGGIGTGRVDICRDGRFRNFSGNNNQDMPFEEPDGLDGAFLSVTENGAEKLLATRPMHGIEPLPEGALSFEAAFPRARLSAASVFDALDVSVLFSGPLTPHDLDRSCLPVALAEWTLVNRSDAPRRVVCRWSWPNLVGSGGGIRVPERSTGMGDGSYTFFGAPGNPAQADVVLDGDVARGRRFTNDANPDNPSADGEHFLLVIGGGTVGRGDGSVSETVVLAPGATAKVRMALIWAMPCWMDSRGTDRGLYWSNRFATPRALAAFVATNFDNLLAGASAWVDFIGDHTLEPLFRERLLNSCYPLVTNSVLFRDGRFSINEGPTEMSGCYGTIDQRLGSHPATQILFPQLNAVELGLFAAVQAPDGGINHDLGSGHLENPPRPSNWPDIACSFVIQMARHARTTGDDDFARRHWPQVKKALRFHGDMADEGNGVAQLGKRGTSYDSYHYIGTTDYIATLWLATLNIARQWAAKENDAELVATLDRWQKAAFDKLEADCWNGSFYRAYAGQPGQVNENSHAGMIAGEVYSRLLASESVLPPERLDACADALLRLNGADTLAVPADEASPSGSGSLYGWLPYIESFMLASCAVLKKEKTLVLWRRVLRALRDGNATPCDTRLMYRPGSGAPSWGAYYMTAPASWLVYDALCDFVYFPNEQMLRLNPALAGTFPLAHPRFWATGRREDDGRLSVEFRRVFGDGDLTVKFLEIPAGSSLVDAGAGVPVPGGRYARVEITPFAIAPGRTLSWRLG